MSTLEDILSPSNYIGSNVLYKHNSEYDKEYVEEMRFMRASYSNMTGVIKKNYNTTGIFFEVQFPSGDLVSCEPGELILISG